MDISFILEQIKNKSGLDIQNLTANGAQSVKKIDP